MGRRVQLQRLGVPQHIRSDNDPEFIAGAIRRFLAGAGVETLYIEPGFLWQNGYAVPGLECSVSSGSELK